MRSVSIGSIPLGHHKFILELIVGLSANSSVGTDSVIKIAIDLYAQAKEKGLI